MTNAPGAIFGRFCERLDERKERLEAIVWQLTCKSDELVEQDHTRSGLICSLPGCSSNSKSSPATIRRNRAPSVGGREVVPQERAGDPGPRPIATKIESRVRATGRDRARL